MGGETQGGSKGEQWGYRPPWTIFPCILIFIHAKKKHDSAPQNKVDEIRGAFRNACLNFLGGGRAAIDAGARFGIASPPP